MYVCICHGVTEKDIQQAVKQGADSIDALRAKTGATSGCGSCLDVALDVLDANRSPTLPDFLQIIPQRESIPA
ncbi:(2Fe-2S)-binding protein [Marinicella meishanensis]|uniref:(2Fe-2S)-binding protein n=1 Tax=Marinicella meishanensis TaxID=2873263 RepID=UPI001CBDD5C8|nr:(2Fe-2S)-binding protein [Marinicella sp. NBU2979]